MSLGNENGGADPVSALPPEEPVELLVLDELVVADPDATQERPSRLPPPVYPEMGIRLTNGPRASLPPPAAPQPVVRVPSIPEIERAHGSCRQLRTKLDELERQLGTNARPEILTDLRLELSRLEVALGMVSDHA